MSDIVSDVQSEVSVSDDDLIEEVEPSVRIKSLGVVDASFLERKKVDLMQKLDNLLEQSRALLEGKPAAIATNSKKHKKRMTEDEEDEQLMHAVEDGAEFPILLDKQPPNVTGEMKRYQIDGLNWLIRLHEHKVNGILADEMGLGKTLQSISLLAYLLHFRGIKGPHLIVVPKSTMGNWMREVKRWCPVLRPFRFHGDQNQRNDMIRDILKPGLFDVCITSYEIAIREKTALRKIGWYYLIVDEAHRLKNENSLLAVTLRTMACNHRLLLTGTPLQNNLHELWALLNFLLPKLFDSAEEFDEFFAINQAQQTLKTAESDASQSDVVSKLHKVLRPFLLRRLKVDVMADLPPKKETLLYVSLTEMQRTWYKSILTKNFDALDGQNKDRSRLLNMVMQLRKCANHPYLFEGAEDRKLNAFDYHLVSNSGKLKLLDKLLPKLQAQGSRVLIFSQMTRLLDILNDYMLYRNYNFLRIDGQTVGEERDQAVEDFNAPNSSYFVFLLSTRAGGLGINLATADTVILYDSDWNPQMDLQAQDRAHRIGQKKPVNVYRLVTENTIEEQIIERATFKLHLDAVVIQQGRLAAQAKALSKDEMLQMIRFGADQIFRSKDENITDEDIDIIMARGAAKTAEVNEKIRSMTGDGKNSLQTFSIANTEDVFASDKRKDLAFINVMADSMGKRERKMKTDAMGTYNEKDYYSSVLSTTNKPRVTLKKGQYYDFQFFNLERIQEIDDIERAAKEASDANLPSESIRFVTEAEYEERNRLLEAGFVNWGKADHHALIRALEHCGRDDLNGIYRYFPKKDIADVKKYLSVFWKRLNELADKEKILKVIEKGETFRSKHRVFVEALANEVKRYEFPLDDMEIDYNPNRSAKVKGYTEEEDRYLLVETHAVGYGHWEDLHKSIQTSSRFCFDYYLKSRSPAELARRVDSLVCFWFSIAPMQIRLLLKANGIDDGLPKVVKKRKEVASSPKMENKAIKKVKANPKAIVEVKPIKATKQKK